MCKVNSFSLIKKVFLLTSLILCKWSSAGNVETPQYVENLYTLKDLTGVYVVLDYVKSAVEKSHLTIKPELEQEIKKRLESGGLKLLSKDEMLKTPGNPELDIFPNFPAYLSAEPKDAETSIPASNLSTGHQCCYTSVWGSFSQGSLITRNPNEKFRLSTWGNGSNTDSCDQLGEWMNDATLKIIDNFVADYKKSKETKPKANNEQNKAVAETSPAIVNTSEKIEYVRVKEIDDTKGMTCNTALMVYAQIFKANSATISDAKAALLEKLASHMLACKNHRYRIETHPDKKGTKKEKDLLSAQRTITLHDYLLDKGIEEDQFEMRFLSNRKTKSGDKEEDVVITPLN